MTQIVFSILGSLKRDLLQIHNSVLQKGSQGRNHSLHSEVGSPKTVQRYRPITLLNRDYRILARAITNRLRPTLKDITHRVQSNSTLGRSRTWSVNGAERAGCIPSLDSASTVDKISHEYLYFILDRYGFGKNVVNTIETLYGGAQTRVQIKVFLSHPFPLER
jgi:hypothetical protein